MLIDTQVLVWWQLDSSQLSKRALKIFLDPKNELFWSVASTWEIAIKVSRKKMTLPGPARSVLPRVLSEQSITVLPIEQVHALHVAELPLHHGDPFDRMLVAQAQMLDLKLLSSDKELSAYDVERVW